jgi:hypothetical protein
MTNRSFDPMSYHTILKNHLVPNRPKPPTLHDRAPRIPHHAPPRKTFLNETLGPILQVTSKGDIPVAPQSSPQTESL